MGPFGIEQVDVPGILSAYTAARANRQQQIMQQRQMDREDRADERDIARTSALAKVFAPQQSKGGDPASSGPGQPASPAPAPAPAPVASDGVPRTDGLQVNQEALAALRAADPTTASQIDTMVYNADKHQLETVQRKGEAMAMVAYRLKSLPQDQWAAELQANAPYLQQAGFTPEEIAKADLTPAGIDRAYQHGRKLSELVSESEPKYMAPQPGAPLVNSRDPAAVGAYNLSLGMGAPSPQGGGTPLPRPKTQQEYDALPPGPYIGKNGEHLVKGGASPTGSQTFSGPHGF